MPDGMKHSRTEPTMRVSEAIQSDGESGVFACDTLNHAPHTPENLVDLEKVDSERRAELQDPNRAF